MDFIDLSINDIEEIDGYNSIFNSETIEELFMNIYKIQIFLSKN